MALIMLFGLSYAVLCGLVVLEGAMLRETLRDIVWLKQFCSGFYQRVESAGLPRGTRAPDFSAPLLATGQVLKMGDLKGDPTILLFVSPMEASLPGYQQLAIAIHALWHQVEGRIYLVCSGSEEACRQFALDHHVHGFAENQVPMVLDNEAFISRSFQIDSTPTAVELDEDVRVNRYGRPAVRALAPTGGEEPEEAEEVE
jgi:AhpC/TSA family protein